jgi:cytochrome c-type biogenesis protein CcmH
MNNELGLLVGLFGLIMVALVIALYPLRKEKFSIHVLSPVILFLSASAYWYWGAWPEWSHYRQQQARQKDVQAMLRTVKGPQELINKLTAHLTKQPDSARGWYLLGRLYAGMNEWSNARDAYGKAHQLEPGNEQVTVNYAQSLWQVNHKIFDDRIRNVFQEILKTNSEQPDTLAMLAMDAYQRHSDQEAIAYWQRLLKLAPTSSDEAELIRKAIAKASARQSSGRK